jgi:4-amino-4-deoxy-L-arabinose transferase-like glycosyltransferase
MSVPTTSIERQVVSDLRRLPRTAPRPGLPRRRPRTRARQSRLTRIDAWLAAHAASLAIAGVALAIAAAVLGTGIAQYPAFSDDEGTYAAQAWAVRAHGSLAHYTYWYDHPPLGWLQLAGLTWLLAPFRESGSVVAEARSLMLLPALASAALLFVLARRLGLRRPFAAGAVLLFVLSPLAVTSLRMVFLDNLATPWILGAFVLAASPERRLWAYAGSGICLAVAVLTKETSLLVLPGLIVALRQGVDHRTRAFCITAFATVLVLAAAAYPLFAALKGELLPGSGHVSLIEAAWFQLFSRPSDGSALSPGSHAHELVSTWLALDPWLLGLGVIALPAALWTRRLRPPAVTLLTLLAMAVRPGYLPQPYVITLLPFSAVVAMGVLDSAWGRGAARDARRLLVGAVVLIVVLPLGRAWFLTDRYAVTADQTRPVLAAQRWMQRHVDPRARALVDDTLYVDLVRAGFAPRVGAVWFYKLDFSTNLDPSIVRQLPGGWKAFDYVVSSEIIRSALTHNPSSLGQVRLALTHSTPVATFGAGRTRVEVRRMTGPGNGSGLLPQAPPSPPPAVAATPSPPAAVAAAPSPPTAVAAAPRPAKRATPKHKRAARKHRAHRRAKHRGHRRGGRR